MNRVIHFEMVVDDPERAIGFYQNVFGWKVNRWEGPQTYWLLTTGPNDQPGINGGMMQQQKDMPRTINTIEVASVDDYVEKVTSNGGKVVMPKMAVPGIGHQAYCQDTEGNWFGIHQMDPNAK